MKNLLPQAIQDNYEIYMENHPLAILYSAYPAEWNDLIDLLTQFTLNKSDILKAGGRKSPIAENLDSFLYEKGWKEEEFQVDISVNSHSKNIPTHKIDCFRNKIGIEIEWNNKDPFFDRDLNNFRLLHNCKALEVGIIITRSTHLQNIFKDLGKGSSYGSSTTHMDKLIPRIQAGGAGGCPIVAFGITNKLYDANK